MSVQLLEIAPPSTTAPADALRVALVDDGAPLAALADEWNAISGDVPFRRHEWLAVWWRHFRGRHDRLFVAALRDPAGELCGLAPFYQTDSPRSGKLLRFFGSGAVASDHLSILSAPGCASAAGSALAAWLADEQAGQWDRIELDGVDSGDVAVEQFCAGLQSAGRLVHASSVVGGWSLPLPESWEGYLKTLSRSRRNRVRRLFRECLDSGRGELCLARSPEDVLHGFQILIDLHQRRRESLGDRGCFESLPFLAFHQEAMQQFARLGRLRLCWLEIDGQPAAIEYHLLGGGASYFYQSGLEPAFERQRPGWLAKGVTIRLAIEDGLHTFDFLRGDEAYKKSWGATRRPVMQYRIVARRPAALARHSAWRLVRGVKQGLKPWLRRPSQPLAVVDPTAGHDEPEA